MTFTERQRIADIVCAVVVGAVVVIALLSLVGCATPDAVFLALPGDDATADARTRPVDPGGPVPRIERVDAESCRVYAPGALWYMRGGMVCDVDKPFRCPTGPGTDRVRWGSGNTSLYVFYHNSVNPLDADAVIAEVWPE